MEFITSSLSYLPVALEAVGTTSKSDALSDAGINTLLGMGTAFAVLILISLIISLFPLIGKVGKRPEVVAPAAKAPEVKEVVEEENLADDDELVAVIAAAIAAYEGSSSVSGDGFVVRSIRKRRSGARA